MYRRLTTAAACLLACLFGLTAAAEPFRLAVLPDTQWAVENWPHLVTAMTEWIVKNRDAQNIKYVLHVGDMVQVGDAEEEWKRFRQSMSLLDGKVPYVLTLGNHDYGKAPATRGSALFEKYFPPERFARVASLPTSEQDHGNSYRTFTAGGIDWLIVAMPFLPGDMLLEGADRVVAANPNRRVIVLTHSYLTHTGRDKSGERIWKKLVHKHGNISMVLCGHLSTVHFVSQGNRGNKVYEMLFDWQNDVKPDFNSYFAILTIDPEAARISVKSYAPHLDKYLTDPRAQFEFQDVDFLKARKQMKAAR